MSKIRFILFWLLTLPAMMGFGQATNKLYIDDIRMSRNAEAVVSVQMENNSNITAVEFLLEVPNGFSINLVSATLSERAKNHTITARKMRNGKYKFVIVSTDNSPISGIAGRLFTVRIKSDNTVTDEVVYSLVMSNAVMATQSGSNIIDSAEGGKVTIKSMPNLHITSLDCSEPVAGTTLNVRWKVRNDGRGTTGDTQWTDYIWMVPNISGGTTMAGSKLLGKVSNVSALASGEYYENSVNVLLEERIYGNYDLVVTTDINGISGIDFSNAGGTPPIPYAPESSTYGFLTGTNPGSSKKLEEENELDNVSDNFFYKRIDIAVPPLPDLQVPSVVAAIDNSESYEGESNAPSPIAIAGLGNSTTFYSGKKVKVTATIKNGGNAGFTEKNITNELYLSSTPGLESGTIYKLDTKQIKVKLNQDETTTCELTGYLPYDWYGDTYFVVRVDVNDEVYELANTGNNFGVSSRINTLLTPGADFEPYKLSVPNTAANASPLEIGYSVRNIGPGVPFKNNWIDKIYISSKNSGIDDTAKLISTIQNKGSYQRVLTGPVAPRQAGVMNPGPDYFKYEYKGDNYVQKHICTLPELPVGDYYVYVAVDADNDIFEYDGENNNIVMSGKISVKSPDLTSELLSASQDSVATGSVIAFTWKIKNIGTSNISNTNLTDVIYASVNANKSNPIKLGSFSNMIDLMPNGERTLRANLTIPKASSLNGDLFVFVKTNDNSSIAETNIGNNTSNVLPIKFSYIEDPKPEDQTVSGYNLSLYNISVPNESTPGAVIPVTFNIKNTGSKPIDHRISLAAVISRNKNMNDVTKCNVSSFPTDNVVLAPGENRSYPVNLEIPAGIQGGQNYIELTISGGKTLPEKSSSDNSAKVPVYLNGNLAELSISNMTAPKTVKTSQPFDISWNIVNNGSWESSPITGTVYLSKDAVLSNDDIKLDAVRSESIAVGASKSVSRSLTFNDSQYGNYYLIISAISDNSDDKLANDHIVQAISSAQSPLPDLMIRDVTSEGKWRSGETAVIKATISNVGDSITRKDKWTDVFYLSDGYDFNPSTSIKIGSKTHVGELSPGEKYDLLAEIKLPVDVKGYYVLNVVADGTDALVEKNKDNNRQQATVCVEDANDTPAELTVNKLSVPSTIAAGEPFSISYTIANNGEYIADGLLRDVFFLSKDNKWDESDVMIGYASGEVEIESGSEIERSVSGRLTNVPEGNYYLIVRTNSTHNIPETDYDNNTAVMSSSSRLDFTRLALGSSETVQTSGLFKLDVQSDMQGKTLGIYLSQPAESSAGLYTSFDNVPSTAKYDLSATGVEEEEQELLIPDVKEGTYYILAQDNAAVGQNLNEFVIDGERDLPSSTMNITAREVHFGATKFAITEGGTNGRLSTDVQGALFDSIMDFRLVNGSHIIPAEAIIYKGQTSSKATFYLANAEVGQYDVISELPDGTQATLPSYFTVVPSTNVNLGVKLDAPKATRINGFAPVSVTYVNSGQNDITISELLLTVQGGQLSPTIEGFATNPQTEIHIKPNLESDKFGYVTIPPGKQETVNFYFKQTSGYTYLKLYIVK